MNDAKLLKKKLGVGHTTPLQVGLNKKSRQQLVELIVGKMRGRGGKSKSARGRDAGCCIRRDEGKWRRKIVVDMHRRNHSYWRCINFYWRALLTTRHARRRLRLATWHRTTGLHWLFIASQLRTDANHGCAKLQHGEREDG